MTLNISRATAIILILVALIPSAFGHGSLVRPRSRGTLNCNTLDITPRKLTDDVQVDNCPHCQNAGGAEAVKNSMKGTWRVYDPVNTSVSFRRGGGLCGDPVLAKRPRPHEKGGIFGQSKSIPYTMEYISGQVVEFVVELTTSHNGFFEFFICDVGKCDGDISEKCFKEGHCHRLLREPNLNCDEEQSMSCAPVDEDYPGRWYIPCRINDDPENQKQFLGGEFMRYRLPKDFACDDCVIQWYYATAHVCSPPGMNEFFQKYHMDKWGFCLGDATSLGGRQPTLEDCGGPDNLVPEEVWNCADVRVHRLGEDLPDTEPRSGLVVELPESATALQNAVNTECPSLNRTEMALTCAEFTRMYPGDYLEDHRPASAAVDTLLHSKESVQGAQSLGTKYGHPTKTPTPLSPSGAQENMSKYPQNTNLQQNSTTIELAIITESEMKAMIIVQY